MSTFADKSREQLRARTSAATLAEYTHLDESDSQVRFALRPKKIRASVVIQRWYRNYVYIWRHYGPSAFVGRQPDQVANFGKIFFPCVLCLGI